MKNEQETIERAKTDFLRAKQLLCDALETTPDDRVNWSPSATSRTPIQLVAHAASALEHIREMLNGHTFAIPTTAEADKFFRESEQQFRTREQVLLLLEENSTAYLQFLDTLTPEALGTSVEMPFGLGKAPMSAALSAAIDHTKWHASQIDYIQTIYGDRVWH